MLVPMTAQSAEKTLTWLLRAGTMLGSLVTTMPLWMRFDPMPVLAVSDEERRLRDAAMREAAAEDEWDIGEVLDPEDDRDEKDRDF